MTVLFNVGWYTLLCLEDHKEYLSTAKNMETVDGLEVAEEELRTGDVVVWQYRGAPYKAEIQAVHGMQYCMSYIKFIIMGVLFLFKTRNQCQKPILSRNVPSISM